MKTYTFNPIAAYNLAVTLDAYGRFPSAVDAIRDGAYYRLLDIDGAGALIRARQEAALNVEILARDAALSDEAVLARARHVLSVDLDWRGFYSFAQADAQLGRIIQPVIGIRPMRAQNPFEALATSIIEQQISLKTALRAQGWLAQSYGAQLEYDGEVFYAFPRADVIAALTSDDLKPLKITGKRIAALHSIAREIALLDFESSSPAETYQALVRLHGVGHWTATWTLVKYRGVYAHVPYQDVGLQAAVNHYYHGQAGRATPDATAAIFARYGEHAGLAAYHVLMRWVLDRY